MKKRILSNVLLFLALTMMVGCGMITPQVRKDIPYGKSIEFDKAFD